MNYCPDLDRYDRALAHEFAKEMGGPDLKAVSNSSKKEFYEVKGRLNIEGKRIKSKKSNPERAVEQLKFAAGVLSKETQELTGMARATVWLSDDTLVKQVDSREDRISMTPTMLFLPDMLQNPEHVIRDNRELIFTARYKGSA